MGRGEKIAAIVFGVLVLAGCGAVYYWEQLSLLSLFEFDLSGLQVLSFSGNQINVQVTMKLTSHSNIEATVSNINVQIYINGTATATVDAPQAQIIPANGYNMFTANVLLQSQDLLSQVLAITSEDYTTPIVIRTVGAASVKSGFISVACPFDQTFNTTLNELIAGVVS